VYSYFQILDSDAVNIFKILIILKGIILKFFFLYRFKFPD
jgi:hypothetical protein